MVEEGTPCREELISKTLKNNFVVEIKDVFRNKKDNREEVNILMKLY
jgi:hypothetical protein